MGGWHAKVSEEEQTLSYEEQLAAQAKASRSRRRGRRQRIKKMAEGETDGSKAGTNSPIHLGEID